MSFAFLLCTLSIIASAGEKLSTPEVGEHYKLFIFEKSVHPENIAVIYTKLDANCRIQSEKNAPLVDGYWLMDGKRFKPMHSMIKSALRKRFRLDLVDGHSLKIKPLDLPQTKIELHDPYLIVRTKSATGGCAVDTLYTDEHGKQIKVDALYSRSEHTLRPPFQRLISLKIMGSNAVTGQPEPREYSFR